MSNDWNIHDFYKLLAVIVDNGCEFKTLIKKGRRNTGKYSQFNK